MGVYLTVPVESGKAEWLIEHGPALRVEPVEPSLTKPSALICVLDYSPSHEAAAYVFSDEEFRSFAESTAARAGRADWLLMDREQMMQFVVGRDLMELQDMQGVGG